MSMDKAEKDLNRFCMSVVFENDDVKKQKVKIFRVLPN